MGIGAEVSEVLASDPDDDVIEELVEQDIIPSRGPGGGNGRPAAERDERVINLLEEILAELRDDVVAQDGDAP